MVVHISPVAPVKYKDKYRKALVEKFGKGFVEKYYSMTKSHYKYVKKAQGLREI